MSENEVEFGFVAALEREVSGLVQGWTSVRAENGQRRIYTEDRTAVICAGTGVGRAYAATKVLIEKCSPRMIVSIGFAGSCVTDLRPGAVVVPAMLVEAATGRTFQCGFGSGQVATLDCVAGRALKQDSCERFGVIAVDMEATGVAAAAAEEGREFAAIKVISDGAEEDLGFLSDFVKPEGFETGRFIAHIALRPRLWASVATLQRNSKVAVAALESAVRECMKDARSFAAKHSSSTARV